MKLFKQGWVCLLFCSSAYAGYGFNCTPPSNLTVTTNIPSNFSFNCFNDTPATFSFFAVSANQLGNTTPATITIDSYNYTHSATNIQPGDTITINGTITTTAEGNYQFDFSRFYNGETHPGALCNNNANSSNCFNVTASAIPPNLDWFMVADANADSVFTYPLTATGVTTPTYTLKAAVFTDTAGLAVDSNRNPWVSNDSGVSPALGRYSTWNNTSATANQSITPGAGTYTLANQLGMDAAGSLYVADNGTTRIDVFTAGNYTSQAYALTSTVLSSFDINGLYVAPSGKVYVSSREGVNARIYVFAANAQAGAVPLQNILPSTFGGSSRYEGIALDSAGDIWITDIANNAVYKFAGNADGFTVPSVTIQGSNTGLSGPTGIAIDEDDNIYVSNTNASNIKIFAPTASGNVSPTTTISSPGVLIAPYQIVIVHGMPP